ncbi:hypothetical protein KKA14_11400, partial [bacterium]|nr:hypothetical protein [bacterium]
IQKIDTPMEIIDYQKGTHHTRLMRFWSGIRYQESPVFGSRQSLLLGGAIYHQELGDHSFNAMQRGTYVDFGKIELDLVNDENDRLVINDWHLTALKIRKIKARRHYIPPLKLGLGFTVLEMSRLNWLSSNNKTLLVAGEVFSSLVSSRLNLDYLNMSIGAGVESPWTQKDDWRDKLYNKNRVIDFSAKMDGLLTFGEDRNAQLRGDIAYHYRLDELDSSSQYQLDEILTAKLGFQWRLPEFHQTELLLIGGVSYGDTFRKNADGNEIKQISLQVGLEMNRW